MPFAIQFWYGDRAAGLFVQLREIQVLIAFFGASAKLLEPYVTPVVVLFRPVSVADSYIREERLTISVC